MIALFPRWIRLTRPACLPKKRRRRKLRNTRLCSLLPPARHRPISARRCFVYKHTCSLCRSNSTNSRSEEHTSELQSRLHLVCRLLLEKKKKKKTTHRHTKQHEAPV